MKDVDIVSGGTELLDRIAPLWEKLRDHHVAVSSHFSAETAAHSFASRKSGLVKKAQSGRLRIDLATSGERVVGYCVSSVNAERVGEVESIYVEPEFRGGGTGTAFMNAAMKWMDEIGTESRIIGVGVGNERALNLYARFDFLPRTVILMRKRTQRGRAT